ncbi:MAG TPA: mandelate racemase/muconate lactonizing enzyme family protein [Chloroflexota bacterium]|nr:mandelate racemase/muconate lactonizing enzyme family protein [Chloroflexota bacterium]
MKVERVEVVAVQVSPPPELAALRALKGEWVFVVAHGAFGVRGYGEATHSGDDDACARLVRQAWGPALDDEALPDDPNGLEEWVRLASPPGTDPSRDRVAATAYSAVETALCDLAARTREVPLWQWLGDADARGGPAAPTSAHGIPLYATLNRGIFDRSPAGFADAARRAQAEGFTRVKCAPFDGVERGGALSDSRQAAITQGIDRVAAVREAVGPNVELMVDCHGRLSETEAIEVAIQLAALGVIWFEEPVPFDPDPSPLARVRRAVRSHPNHPVIAAGELMFGVDGFRPLLESAAVDHVMPDVKHCGGLLAARTITREAAQRGVGAAPHNPSGPISTLASAHLCAALGGMLEYAWGEVPWRASLLTPTEHIRDGALYLPEGPGLGADLDPDTLREHAFAL